MSDLNMTKESLHNPFDIPLLILVVFMAIGMFFLIKDSRGYYQEEYIIVEGIVTEKHIDEYACGKHKQSTCTRFYLNINNNRNYVVTEYEYNGVSVNQYHILKGTVNKTPWYAVMFILSLLPCFILGIICLPMGLAHESILSDRRKELEKYHD